jgi:hypothetical protein
MSESDVTPANVRAAPARWWLKPLVSVVALLAMLPLMEVVVRIAAPQPPSWLAIYRPHPALPVFALQANVEALVDTGESRWTVHTDGEGFRVGDANDSREDRPVGLWLGDSYTFGQGVSYDDSFVGRLGHEPHRRLRFVNAGVGGYGPTQYRQTLEYLLGTGVRPSVVLVGTFLGNDFFDCVWNKEFTIRDGVLGDDGGWRSFLKRHSHLYRLAAAAAHRIRPPPVSQDLLDRQMADPRNWADGDLRDAERVYREEFARMASLCRERGIELAVVVIPRATTVDALARGAPAEGSDPALPVRHALAVFRDLGIRHLDLTPALVRVPVDQTYFHYDGHFTPRGHALASDEMRRAWGDLLLVR